MEDKGYQNKEATDRSSYAAKSILASLTGLFTAKSI